MPYVEWSVGFTDEFQNWWNRLSEAEQEDVNAKIMLLQRFGPSRRPPHVGRIDSSKHQNMKELTIQHPGKPDRVLFALTRVDAQSC